MRTTVATVYASLDGVVGHPEKWSLPYFNEQAAAYQTELLPPFWRFLSNALPTGAGTDTVRRIVYLGSHGINGHLIVISIWATAGAVITVIASHLRYWLSVRKNKVNSPAGGTAIGRQ